jgi:hypothetical protein
MGKSSSNGATRKMRDLAVAAMLVCCAATVESGDDYSSNHRLAVHAFDAGVDNKRRGNLKQAEQNFNEAFRYAPKNSELRQRALDELEYELPLLNVQRLVLTGHGLAAELELKKLLEAHAEHPQRRTQLEKILANLDQLTRSQQPQSSRTQDGQYVMEQVRRRLAEYHAQNEGYPAGYRELNRLLPADTPPLDYFDVIHYTTIRGGFTLVLRSKTDRQNTLTIQKTGLLR